MEEVFELFNQAGIRYLLIGGQAMRMEGMPRFSMDWDVYIPGKDDANIAAINKALADEIDVPLVKLGADGSGFIQTYQTRWGILQFHLAGPGLPPFDQAYSRCVVHKTDKGVKVRCLAPEDLLTAKQAADRPQDQDDILFLKERLGL